MNAPTEKPALFVEFKSERSYDGGQDLTIDAGFCVVPTDGKVYPRGTSTSDNPLAELHFIIRGGNCALRCSEGKSAFHGSVSIVFNNCYYVDLTEIEAMAKALKSVHRKLDALRERFGYAETPFALLARYADVLGITAIFMRNDDETKRATGEAFRMHLGRADGLSAVNYEARRMELALQPKTEVAA